MTVKAELGYMEYASLCGPGCDLPESIQDEIEEFCGWIDRSKIHVIIRDEFKAVNSIYNNLPNVM